MTIVKTIGNINNGAVTWNNAAGSAVIGSVTNAGAWTLGASTTNAQHTIQSIAAAGTLDLSYPGGTGRTGLSITQNAATVAYIMAAGSIGDIVTGSAVGDLTIRTTNNLLFGVGATKVGGYTSAGAWTLGPASTTATNVIVNGSVNMLTSGAAFTAQATTPYIGSKLATSMFATDGTAYTTGGMYYDGNWKNSIANKSGSTFAVLAPASGVGTAFSWYAQQNYASAADTTLALTQVGLVSGAGAWTLGPSSGLTSAHVIQSHSSSSTIPVLQVYSRYSAATDAAVPAITISKTANDGSTAQVFMRFEVNGNAAFAGIRADNGGSAQFYALSDRRLKNDIVDLDGSLSKILALRPVSFKFKTFHTDGKSEGFIAQEFAKVFPQAVTSTDDGEGDEIPQGVGPWTLGKDGLIVHFVKALQELSAKNDALEARLAVLEV